MDFTITNGATDHKPGGPDAGNGRTGDHDDHFGARAGHERAADERPALLPQHLAELRASGLTDGTLAANAVHSETDPAAVADLLDWGKARAKLLGPVLVYPHHDRDGRSLGHATVKPDSPRDRKDKPGKVK
jgi:hypothetical protein